MKSYRILGTIICFVVMLCNSASATHIVGGEITYKCLGNNQYRIQLDIYQDCINGEPNAIAEDNPAFIGIFAKDGSLEIVDTAVNATQNILVPANFKNDCVNNAPPTCLRKLTFIKTYTLPPRSSGYRVVYTRCCRNAAIINIKRPSENGATYICDIPGTTEATCNNSAVFRNFPPQIICINNPLVYDHSAFDSDGDSLSYEFCDSYVGGTPNQPKPIPSSKLPPALSVMPGYNPPFSATQPMRGNPLVKIDPATGIITGTPNVQGRFVVTVCCHEWRNGVRINTVRREFQFVVTNCSKAVIADIPILSDEPNTYIIECQSKTVFFRNNSIGGFNYFWDFGIAGGTSTEFQPTFTYPDTGTFTVKLVVNRGSTCPDSISRIVKVYPTISTDYSFTGLYCPNSEISFFDSSDATFKPILNWNWDFGDGEFSNAKNPKHAYTEGGDYNVTLISKSSKGCTDTATKVVSIERFKPFAGNDTAIVKGEYINFNATGGIEYRWDPATNLNDSNISNPRGFYPDTGRFSYIVYIRSENNCTGSDTLNVLVVGNPDLFVPSAFTPNGDGLNDFLKPISVGYSKFEFFRVLNRWGELVYHTNDIGAGWNGQYKGRKAEVGTYFWVLKVINRYGQVEMIKGDATLLR